MAGVVYMKSNSSVSLTGAEYTDLSIPSGAKTLYVQTGSATSDRVKYGLTTDTSASVYSPKINVNGTTMYIASGGTVTETVTTDTVYHTGTRASTSSSGLNITGYLTTTFARTSLSFCTAYNTYYKRPNITFLYNRIANKFIYDRRVIGTKANGETTVSSYRSGNVTHSRYSRTIRTQTNSATSESTAWSGSYSSTYFNSQSTSPSCFLTGVNDTVFSNYTTVYSEILYSTNASNSYCYFITSQKGGYPIWVSERFAFDARSHYNCTRSVVYSIQGESVYLFAGSQTSNQSTKSKTVTDALTVTDTVTTGVAGYETYATCSSTYTSRTEYLTSSRTYTTNNIAA